MSELQHKSPEQAQPPESHASEFTPPEFVGHSELDEARQQAELDHAERTESKELAVADALDDVHELFESDTRESQPPETVGEGEPLATQPAETVAESVPDSGEKQETKSIYDIGAPVLMVELEHLSHARNMGPRSAQKDPSTIEAGWRISAVNDKTGTFTLEKPQYDIDADGNKIPGEPKVMKGVSTVDLIAWNHNANDLKRVQQEKLEGQDEQQRRRSEIRAAAAARLSRERLAYDPLESHIFTDPATGNQWVVNGPADAPATPSEHPDAPAIPDGSPAAQGETTSVADFGAPSVEPRYTGGYMSGHNWSEVGGAAHTPNSGVGLGTFYAKHEAVKDEDGYGVRSWWRKRKAARKRRKELQKQGKRK